MKDLEKNERKLSRAEIKRKEEFERLSAKLVSEGYTQKLIEISKTELNTMAFLVTLPLIIPFLILFFALGHKWDTDIIGVFVSILIFCVLIVVHEALHGMTWMIFAKRKWRSISFGIITESFTPYCNCNEPLKKYQMILGALMPTLVLGVGFGIAAIVSGSSMLLFTAFLNIIGGGGDLLVTMKLLSYRSDAKKVLFIDHPYEIGTAVFEKRQ